jgi:hypothetical protein
MLEDAGGLTRFFTLPACLLCGIAHFSGGVLWIGLIEEQ